MDEFFNDFFSHSIRDFLNPNRAVVRLLVNVEQL